MIPRSVSLKMFYQKMREIDLTDKENYQIIIERAITMLKFKGMLPAVDNFAICETPLYRSKVIDFLSDKIWKMAEKHEKREKMYKEILNWIMAIFVTLGFVTIIGLYTLIAYMVTKISVLLFVCLFFIFPLSYAVKKILID